MSYANLYHNGSVCVSHPPHPFSTQSSRPTWSTRRSTAAQQPLTRHNQWLVNGQRTSCWCAWLLPAHSTPSPACTGAAQALCQSHHTTNQTQRPQQWSAAPRQSTQNTSDAGTAPVTQLPCGVHARSTALTAPVLTPHAQRTERKPHQPTATQSTSSWPSSNIIQPYSAWAQCSATPRPMSAAPKIAS